MGCRYDTQGANHNDDNRYDCSSGQTCFTCQNLCQSSCQNSCQDD